MLVLMQIDVMWYDFPPHMDNLMEDFQVLVCTMR